MAKKADPKLAAAEVACLTALAAGRLLHRLGDEHHVNGGPRIDVPAEVVDRMLRRGDLRAIGTDALRPTIWTLSEEGARLAALYPAERRRK